jgi:hypothetical protein
MASSVEPAGTPGAIGAARATAGASPADDRLLFRALRCQHDGVRSLAAWPPAASRVALDHYVTWTPTQRGCCARGGELSVDSVDPPSPLSFACASCKGCEGVPVSARRRSVRRRSSSSFDNSTRHRCRRAPCRSPLAHLLSARLPPARQRASRPPAPGTRAPGRVSRLLAAYGCACVRCGLAA